MTIDLSTLDSPRLKSGWLESENRRVDRGFEAAIDRQIGAVDPARAV
jgi:hypothetical protein